MIVITGITIKGYCSICRISNLPSIWTNVLCASILAAGGFSWTGYLVPALSLSCFYLAGMSLNDICDVAYDQRCRSSRPIPSGSVSYRGALILTITLFSVGFALLSIASRVQALYAASILVAVIVWYDLNHKRNRFSVLLMASCRFLVFAVTSLAMTGEIVVVVLLAGSTQFAYTVCLSLVARYENNRVAPFTFPVIPTMLAGIALLDGLILALLVTPIWLLAGVGGAILIQEGQRCVRGD